MIRALALKELREIWPIALLGLGVFLAQVASLAGIETFDEIPGMPRRLRGVPFVGDGFLWNFAPVGALLAVALALRQTLGESVYGTYLFLLHRPMDRSAIIAAKLAVGIVVLSVSAAVPIIVYGLWAATPGTHPSPFEWSMTAGAWWTCLLMPLIYLGAFTAGFRDRRWFGTRLLPLAATGFVVFLLMIGVPLWIGLPILAIAYVLVLVGIWFTARTRDYS